MARNNNKLTRRKRHAKVEPAVHTMTFATPGEINPGQTKDYTIDLSQCASLMNRRFYRQGINWAVDSIKIISAEPTLVSVLKLPNTWVMSNAWEKSFRTWQRMNNEALEESESVRPKFLDFKIYADSAHHDAGYAGNLLPYNNGGFYVEGEWFSSKIHVPIGVGAAAATAEYEFIATGASYPGASTATGLDAVSLIEGYAASRGLPDVLDPNTPSDASDATGADPENWMGALFSEGTTQDSDVLEDMITENNLAPYPFENGDDGAGGVFSDTMYPNGANQAAGLEIHDIESITSTTIGGITYIKGGNFPCGLIRLSLQNTGSTDDVGYLIQVNLVPGTHRGYLCEPMTDM